MYVSIESTLNARKWQSNIILSDMSKRHRQLSQDRHAKYWDITCWYYGEENCRFSPSYHHRQCWAIIVVLGKEEVKIAKGHPEENRDGVLGWKGDSQTHG